MGPSRKELEWDFAVAEKVKLTRRSKAGKTLVTAFYRPGYRRDLKASGVSACNQLASSEK